jgi:hypothetical protein
LLLEDKRERERRQWRLYKGPRNSYHLRCLKIFPILKRRLQTLKSKYYYKSALVSTIAAIDPSLDNSFRAIELIEEELQADYIPLDVDDVGWN